MREKPYHPPGPRREIVNGTTSLIPITESANLQPLLLKMACCRCKLACPARAEQSNTSAGGNVTGVLTTMFTSRGRAGRGQRDTGITLPEKSRTKGKGWHDRNIRDAPRQSPRSVAEPQRNAAFSVRLLKGTRSYASFLEASL